MDSLGIGAMPMMRLPMAMPEPIHWDTFRGPDERHLTMPNLQKIGMANLHPLKQVAPAEHPMGYYMDAEGSAVPERIPMTGHWELMGTAYHRSRSRPLRSMDFRRS